MTAATGKSRPAGARGRGEAGFTLIELLVALTLLGLIMAMLFGGLRFGIRTWERSDAWADEAAEMRVVQGFIGRQIAQAYPVVTRDGSTAIGVEFSGTSHSLDFISLVPAHLGVGGLYRIGFALEAGGGARRLVMTRRLFHPDVSGEPGDDDATVLIDGLEDVEFSYFGARSENETPRWYDRWTEASRFPKLVRLRVDFGQGVHRRWPELVVSPKIAIEGGCIYDTITRKCRNR